MRIVQALALLLLFGEELSAFPLLTRTATATTIRTKATQVVPITSSIQQQNGKGLRTKNNIFDARTSLDRLPSSSSSSSLSLTSTTSSSLSIDGSETSQQQENNQNKNLPKAQYDAIICGGGPAGLLSAIMLTQKFGPSYKIAICEQRSTIPPLPSDDEVWNDVARFYLLGIGHRGQKALEKFGVMKDFVNASVAVMGRRDWQPGMTNVEDGKVVPAKKDVVSRVLARDKLVGVLYHHLVENYILQKKKGNNHNIDLLYGYQVEPISFGNDNDDLVRVRITRCNDVESPNESSQGTEQKQQQQQQKAYVASQDSEQLCDVDSFIEASTKLLIGSDGAARTVANAMEQSEKEQRTKMNPAKRLLLTLTRNKPFKVTRFEDDNPRLFKSVPIQLPSDWPKGLNYSARSRNNRITLEALPSNDNGMMCALLLMKPNDEFAAPNVEPSKLRDFFNQEFPQFSTLINDEEMTKVAKKPPSALPAFRYAGPRLHYGKRTLVLGDAAHTVKPYYGLGCNTALEDVQILSDILDEVIMTTTTTTATTTMKTDTDATTTTNNNNTIDPIPQAVPLFSKRRAADAKALVTISRNMDRPGKLFFFNFILPLILDGMFHKMAPTIFGPNMFGMFQRKDLGFAQIQQKKRLDRMLQFTIIGTILTSMAITVKTIIWNIAKRTGTNPNLLALSMTVVGVTVGKIVQTLGKNNKKKNNENKTVNGTA